MIRSLVDCHRSYINMSHPQVPPYHPPPYRHFYSPMTIRSPPQIVHPDPLCVRADPRTVHPAPPDT
eukprot:1195478-Prorocentrum_minimum.AAC.4